MLAKRIIPCLDIKDGRTVKGVHFLNLRDAGDPVELGALYSAAGADELVFLDITATHEKRKTMAQLAREVSRRLSIPFTIGGGIGSVEDAAARDPRLIEDLALQFGSQFVVLAVDAREVEGKWRVHLNGGRIATDILLYDWVREAESRGAGEILFTSMNHDGAKNGFALEATARVSELVHIPVIASGGAGTMAHFYDVFTVGKADAGLAASIFHFKEIEIQDLKDYLRGKGVAIR
jgi:cyclase